MPQEKAFKRRAVSQLRFIGLCMPATSSMEAFRENLSCEEHSSEDFTQRTRSLGAFTEYWWIEQYYIKYYQIFFDINFFGVKTAIISITVSLKRKLGAQSRGGLWKYNSLSVKPYTSYLLDCFYPLLTFHLPLPVMKKKYLCSVFLSTRCIISNSFWYSVIISLLLEGLIRIIKKEQEDDSVIKGSLDSMEGIFFKASSYLFS